MLDFEVIPVVAPLILRGVVVTLELVGAVLLIALPAGLAVALLREARAGWVARPMAAISWVVRGIPPLLLLFLAYFGLNLPPFAAGVAGLSAYATFYMAEAFRAGLRAVPPGQVQAARALALPPVRLFRRVVLPQALPAAVPPIAGLATEIVKGSALTASISVAETLGNAYQMILSTGRAFEILLLVAVIYGVIDAALLMVQAGAERRWRVRA